jgi:hypothetical protein
MEMSAQLYAAAASPFQVERVSVAIMVVAIISEAHLSNLRRNSGYPDFFRVFPLSPPP